MNGEIGLDDEPAPDWKLNVEGAKLLTSIKSKRCRKSSRSRSSNASKAGTTS